MTSDPGNKSADVGVNSGLVLLAAAVAPTHNTDDIVGPVTLTHQRAPGVPLQGRRGGVTSGIQLQECIIEIHEEWHLTHLAGVDASSQVACTEHGVVQIASVDVGSSTFLLRDQEDPSIQQTVRPELL